jgi:L-ascorbate metabolism protein UlaG (beta-lactamase superfamily)
VIGCTWWGHSTCTVELGGVRIATDPVLEERLFHLVRYAATPVPAAADADLVLVSHLHHDHCDVPSLARFGSDVPVVVPRGAEPQLSRLAGRRLLPVAPGDVVDVAGVRIEVLAATHDGRRTPWSRLRAPALGFRVSAEAGSFWFPGDTEVRDDMDALEPVDLALVPVGGWGPTLAEGHLDPEEAVEAVTRVGARWAVPVHWGTFWPAGLRRVMPANHERLFVQPGPRFAAALAGSAVEAVVLAPGERAERPSSRDPRTVSYPV